VAAGQCAGGCLPTPDGAGPLDAVSAMTDNLPQSGLGGRSIWKLDRSRKML
jgi:hypothetical protein